MHRIRVILHVLLILVAGHALAQNFPVRVTTVLNPPYSPFLTDYTDAGTDKLTLQVLLTDITVSEYRCKLRLTIEGANGLSISTNPNFTPPPLLLQGGVPEILYGSDLNNYFRPENLVYRGITQSDIEKNGNKLPEGIYRFTFEVLDYNRNTVISNRGSATAWMLLNDPPFINQPFNNAKLKPIDPQNIVFQWTPRHRGSPNAAFTTEYEVKLVEIWPAGRNPYDAINTARPIFELITDATMVVYGPAETPLVLGREYALQVQARDTGGKDLFKNNGYSEVIRFVYGDECPMPTGLLADNISTMNARVAWQSNSLNTGYVIQYRERRDGAEWFEERSPQSYVKMQRLRPGVTYEYQVAGECFSYRSEFTAQQTLTTVTEDPHAFVCGESQALPPPDGSGPLPVLMMNDVVKAGGFSIIVTKASGANGKFSGEGLAVVPWFNDASVRVTFENITVNQSRQLTGGFINSVWNADSKFLLKQETPVAQDKGPSSEFKSEVANIEADSLISITGAIISVTPNSDGNVVIVTNEGQTITLEKGTSYAVADEIGNGYIVKEDGEIIKTTATDAVQAGERGQREYSSDPNLSVTFTRSEGRAKYGFDEMRQGTLAQHYQQTENGKYVAWKALSSGESDYVKVVADGTTDLTKVKFERVGLLDEELTLGSSDELTLTGQYNAANEELLATYSESDSATKQIVGKVNLVSYEGLTRKLVLVTINNTTFTASTAALEHKMNEIYGQAVVDWEVSSAVGSITVDGVDETKLDDGESGLLSNYTAEMRTIVQAYFDNVTPDGDTYYLFLATNAKGDALGYMPRGKQAGFIFTEPHLSDEELFHTIAHELGHGAFHLKHTFSEFPAIAQGSSDNLMDYSDGAKLNKYQWDHIHDPQGVIGLFEADEEGELVDRVIACLIGATIDVGIQYTFKWVELWFDDKPVDFTDYNAIFAKLDASQVAVSASIACLSSAVPIIPSTKNKILAAVIIGLGDGAYALGDNIYQQYDELSKKDPEASFGELMERINWQGALLTAGTQFAITSISTGVVLYARANPKFINFAKKLEDKIKNQGVAFLEKAGLTSEGIDLLLHKLGIKRIRTYLLNLPINGVRIESGNINVTNHWRQSSPFELDALYAQQIRNVTGSIADLAEEGVIRQFEANGFVRFLTKFGGNNGIDGLLANHTDISKATRIVIIEVKSSIREQTPWSLTLGQGYGDFQLSPVWLNGVIDMMTANVDRTISVAGRALRNVVLNKPAIIERYVIEVDNTATARILRIE